MSGSVNGCNAKNVAVLAGLERPLWVGSGPLSGRCSSVCFPAACECQLVARLGTSAILVSVQVRPTFGAPRLCQVGGGIRHQEVFRPAFPTQSGDCDSELTERRSKAFTRRSLKRRQQGLPLIIHDLDLPIECRQLRSDARCGVRRTWGRPFAAYQNCVKSSPP